MKILLSEVRSTIRTLLREVVCPACNHPGAYIGGMNNVECPNPDCRFFSEKQAAFSKQNSPEPATDSQHRKHRNKLCPCDNDLIIGSPDDGYQCDRCGRDFDQEEFEHLDDVDESDEEELEPIHSNENSPGGDYEHWNDLVNDHFEAGEQWLDIPGSSKDDDSWYEDDEGNLRGYMSNNRPDQRDFLWDPDRGWQPSFRVTFPEQM